jgi:transposase InsO family protein
VNFFFNNFNEFYEDHGIKRLLTMPRFPQQNGMVEGNNISILNMTRSILKTKKMPKEFWTEAVDCVIYLSNRCPTKGLNNMTPQEA